MDSRAIVNKKLNIMTGLYKAEWDKVCKQLRESGYDLSKIKLVEKK